MCFDKTGTLTEDGLDIFGVRPVFIDRNTSKLSFSRIVLAKDFEKLSPNIDSNKREAELKLHAEMHKTYSGRSIYDHTKLLPSEQMLESMATCHSITVVNGNTIGIRLLSFSD